MSFQMAQPAHTLARPPAWTSIATLLALVGFGVVSTAGCLGRPEPGGPAPRDAGADPDPDPSVDGGTPPIGDAGPIADAGQDAGQPAREDAGSEPCADDALDELFEQRIQPLLDEDHVDSCSQCHFGGVQLSNFIRSSPCESMQCLVELGWADLESPDDSMILEFISRATPDGGITEEGLLAEHEAFSAWLHYSATCHDEVCADASCILEIEDAGVIDAGDGAFPYEGPCGVPPTDLDPSCSVEADYLRWLEGPWQVLPGRCEHCHLEEVGVANAPRWMTHKSEPDGAARTMCTVLENGYYDVEGPLVSLLLLKPLALQYGGISHGGGTKILSTNDPAYSIVRDFGAAWADCRAPLVVDAGVADDAGAGPDGGGGVQDVDAGAPLDGGLGDAGL